VVDSNHDDEGTVEVYRGPHKIESSKQKIKKGENRFRWLKLRRVVIARSSRRSARGPTTWRFPRKFRGRPAFTKRAA
jgi:hypothetical protein